MNNNNHHHLSPLLTTSAMSTTTVTTTSASVIITPPPPRLIQSPTPPPPPPLNSPSVAVTITTTSTSGTTSSSSTTTTRQQHGFERFLTRYSCSRCWNNLINYLLRIRVSPEELDQRLKSREIDKYLEKDKHAFRRQVKLLLLGAGESGKSTFLKQMRIIHGLRFDTESIREYQLIIYLNIIKGMQVLVDAREKLEIPWEHPTSELQAQQARLFHSGSLDMEQFYHCSPILHSLWQDSAIKKAYDRRREFQLSDSVSYFLDEIDRIARFDYVPTNKDILYCRKATKGVYEFSIRIQNIPFVFVDVGGQRTQRQKWTKCFDSSVTSILFLVSSSEFDQVLAEDRKTNRLEESRNIFDTIVNNTTFQGISIIIFLNKTDLLEKKVKNPETDIRWYYPHFTGNSHSLMDVQNFILHLFLSVRRTPRAAIYHHFTNAVDTQNIQIVFSSVKDTILQRNLSALMLQ